MFRFLLPSSSTSSSGASIFNVDVVVKRENEPMNFSCLFFNLHHVHRTTYTVNLSPRGNTGFSLTFRHDEEQSIFLMSSYVHFFAFCILFPSFCSQWQFIFIHLGWFELGLRYWFLHDISLFCQIKSSWRGWKFWVEKFPESLRRFHTCHLSRFQMSRESNRLHRQALLELDWERIFHLSTVKIPMI